MKMLIKLDQHLPEIRNILCGLDLFTDKDGNEIFITSIPDYILEIDTPKYYLYPKHLELFKEDFVVVHCNYCSTDDVIKLMLQNEDVDILSIVEFKEVKKVKRKKIKNGKI